MQWIICYDISQAKRRSRACRLLRKYSMGYQKSGFEVPAMQAESFNQLTGQLGQVLSEEEDSLLLFRHSGIGPDWQLGNGASSASGLLLINNW